MKKYQLKERGLLLASYALMYQGFKLLDIEPEKININSINDLYDMKIINLYKKLTLLHKSFANKKINRFVNKRISKIEDSLDKTCQPLYIGLLLINLYIRTSEKKDFTLNSSLESDIQLIIEEYNNMYKISDCTIDKAIDVYLAIYPNQLGFIEYLKLTNGFPFNLERSKND